MEERPLGLERVRERPKGAFFWQWERGDGRGRQLLLKDQPHEGDKTNCEGPK